MIVSVQASEKEIGSERPKKKKKTFEGRGAAAWVLLLGTTRQPGFLAKAT